MEFNKITPHILNGDELKSYVDTFVSDKLPAIKHKEEYFKGNNPYILNRNKDVDGDAPDWKVRVSYARKIVNTVAGYLFKPGNIKYTYQKGKERKDMDDIFLRNREPIKSTQLGKQLSTQGFGFELFLADENGNPLWVVADPKEIIPFYTDDINSKLYMFIRFVERTEGDETVRYIDAYYADIIEHWKEVTKTTDNKKSVISRLGETPNIYSESGSPPIVVYKNNIECIGDFETCIVKDGHGGLIDMYDVLCSDGINEEDRFAWAYLLLSEGLDEDVAKEIKRKRIFENLGKEGFAKFLTKDIPTEFFRFMEEWARKEIHRQTHIPDFLDMSTGGPLTGVALDRLLYDFEFLCASKEAFFKEGLYDRIRMLDSFPGIDITEEEFLSQEIEIVMQRNRPADNSSNADTYNKYKGSLTEKTLIENFAPFVKDADEELKNLDADQEASFERFAEREAQFNIDEEGSTEEGEEI